MRLRLAIKLHSVTFKIAHFICADNSLFFCEKMKNSISCARPCRCYTHNVFCLSRKKNIYTSFIFCSRYLRSGKVLRKLLGILRLIFYFFFKSQKIFMTRRRTRYMHAKRIQKSLKRTQCARRYRRKGVRHKGHKISRDD